MEHLIIFLRSLMIDEERPMGDFSLVGDGSLSFF